ncbi:unnamed protein product [Moneuplotes crassus]|uniref:Uncharacterized protein n=1 Tax=Euplotes crassus TaxID=5936 RepID=A0AAD1XWI9_EUPCR|nr:unnamed protein product [Moneuplotes crassus]
MGRDGVDFEFCEFGMGFCAKTGVLDFYEGRMNGVCVEGYKMDDKNKTDSCM